MANAEQLAILKKGTKVWNKWRAKNVGAHVNLREAELYGADILCSFSTSSTRMTIACAEKKRMDEIIPILR